MALASKALRTALTLGALASVATALPAQAAPQECTGFYSSATLFDLVVPFECIAGDKIYSNFTNLSSNLPGNFNISIIDATPIHNLASAGSFVGGGTGTTYSIGYTVSVAPFSNSFIDQFTTDFTLVGGTGNTKTLEATSAGGIIATAIRTDGTAPAPNVTIPGAVKTVNFVSSLLVTDSNLSTGWSDTIFQAESAGVPGPLPIFGAAAAFGFSRRLRRRIGRKA